MGLIRRLSSCFLPYWKQLLLSFACTGVIGASAGVTNDVGAVQRAFPALIQHLRRYARKGQERVGEIAHVLQESFSSIEVVQAFRPEEAQVRRFAEEEEREVQAALEELMKHRTALVIAHRLSTGRRADPIPLVREGQVAARGTHGELLARSGEHPRLCPVPFGGGAGVG